MTLFTYTVKDKSGKTHKDTGNYPTKEALIRHLQKQEFFIIKIVEDTYTRPAKKKATKKKRKQFRHKKVKLEDLLIFSRQLATMLDAGVPLVRSLTVIQVQIVSEQFYHVVQKIAKDVEEGTALSAALSAHPKIFNQFWISLIEVGEASGTIPKILNKLSFYLEQQADFKTTIISGIIYPLILFSVSMGAIAFFALVVGPKFENIFHSMGAELPWITKTLLMLFRLFRQNFLYIFGSIVIAIFIFRRSVKTYRGKLYYERFLFQAPVIGDIFKLIIVERFASQMAILIDSGVPILYALDITERVV